MDVVLVTPRQINQQPDQEYVITVFMNLAVISPAKLCLLIQGGTKNGAILSHCKYSENSMTELRGNWWTSAILYAEHSH